MYLLSYLYLWLWSPRTMGHWQWDYELQREHWRHWCDQGRFLHSSVWITLWNQTKHGNIINKAACFFSVFMHTNYLDKFGSIRIIFNHFNLKSTPVLNGNNSQNSNKCNKYNSTPLPLLACILGFCLLNAPRLGAEGWCSGGPGSWCFLAFSASLVSEACVLKVWFIFKC